MLKMNFIGVIACLGLIFGTLFEPGAGSPAAEDNGSSGAVLQQSIPTTVQPYHGAVGEAGNSTKMEGSKADVEIVAAPKNSNVDSYPENPSLNITNLSGDNLPGNDTGNSTSSSPPPVTDASTTTLPPTTSAATTNSTSTTTATTPANTTPTTEKPSPVPTTNATIPTTSATTPTTTAATTPTTTTVTNSSSSVAPTSPAVPPTKTAPTTQAPSDKPAEERRFDGPSFIGGIVFALGVTAIAFVAWKFYKARTERNYHTL